MLIQFAKWSFIAAMALFAASSASFITANSFSNAKLRAFSFRIFGAAAFASVFPPLFMWLGSGHGPYMTRFEVLSAKISVAAVIFLCAGIWKPAMRGLGGIVAPCLLLASGVAFLQPKNPLPLPPTLKSLWLVVHVLFANLAVGCLFIAFCVSLHKLIYTKKDGLPKETEYKFTLCGFYFLTVMIIAGAIWARDAWGKYWGFDPIETWSLVTWLLYGLYLHLKQTLGWGGKKLSIYGVIVFLISVFSYFIIPVFTDTLHKAYMAI